MLLPFWDAVLAFSFLVVAHCAAKSALRPAALGQFVYDICIFCMRALSSSICESAVFLSSVRRSTGLSAALSNPVPWVSNQSCRAASSIFFTHQNCIQEHCSPAISISETNRPRNLCARLLISTSPRTHRGFLDLRELHQCQEGRRRCQRGALRANKACAGKHRLTLFLTLMSRSTSLRQPPFDVDPRQSHQVRCYLRWNCN